MNFQDSDNDVEAFENNQTPEKLYKYRSCSSPDSMRNIIKTIVDNEIYLASSWSFNDIFDCRPVIRSECTDAEFISIYVKLAQKRGPRKSIGELMMDAKIACGNSKRDPRILDVSIGMQKELARKVSLAGIYCATPKNDNLLMWSHYADNHKGICLEFNGKLDIFKEAMEVDYLEDRPTINSLKKDSLNKIMRNTLTTKSIDWKYESEWRIIRQVNGVGAVKINPDTLTGIVFGAACEKKTISDITKANFSRANPVSLYKAVADNRHFLLSIVPL